MIRSFNSAGDFIAPVFIAILSAPDLKRFNASSTDLTPPPTVTGIKTFTQFLAKNGVLGKKKDCNCKKRKEKLNKAFPYKK